MLPLYDILSDDYAGRLVERVNQYIASGWAPYGGVAVAIDGTTTRYVQAVVKETP